MPTFKYRPDIDGLRSIAVLSVVLFHINPKWLPSGFLGVDIFFVLSGFLITSIIYREMLGGDFSFKEFYIRRIKRILPLFFVVLITGMLVSWCIFLPKDRGGVADSALSSLVFLANRYFARMGGYFDIASDEKPFLHLWSLSIEEQFYFVFPVFLLLILKSSFLRKNILKVLGLGIVLSLSMAFIDLKKLEILTWDAYYLLHIRAGEMLVGSFLAVYMTEEKRREEKRREEKRGWRDAISIISLFVLVCCFFLDRIFISPLFPGILALVPCVATASLIYANREEIKVAKLLSQKPVVWLGKISYSLYLWHWVVLAIMRYVYQEEWLPWNWKIVAVVIMFGLSVLTYYFIENPCRKLQWSFGKNLVSFYIIPSLVVLLLANAMKSSGKKNQELDYPKGFCRSTLTENCIKGDTVKTPKVLAIGNSYVGHLSPFLDKVGKAEGWSAAIMSVGGGYYFSFDGDYEMKNKESYKLAKDRDKHFMDIYEDYSVIVLVHSYHESEKYKSQIIDTINKLHEKGKKVYVITNVKRANIDPFRDYYLANIGLSFRKLKVDKVFNDSSFIPDSLGVRKIDLTQYIPDDFYIDGKPILMDNDHWNTYGSEKIAQIFISKGKRFIKKEDLE